MEDYYKILGIHPDSTSEDIKEAYRRKAHKYHPDKGGDPQRFKEIQKAFDILSDTQSRKEYDSLFNKSTGSDYSNSYADVKNDNVDSPPSNPNNNRLITSNKFIALAIAVLLIIGISMLWKWTGKPQDGTNTLNQSANSSTTFTNHEIEDLIKSSIPNNYDLHSYELLNLDSDSESEYLVLFEEHKLYNPNTAKETEGLRTLPVSMSIGNKSQSGTWQFTTYQPVNKSEFPSDYFYTPYFLEKPMDVLTDNDGDKVLAVYSYKFSLDGYSYTVDMFRFDSEYGITPVGKSNDTSYYPIVKAEDNLVFTECHPFFDEDGLMNVVTLNLTTFNGRNYTSEANISCEKYSGELFELNKLGVGRQTQEIVTNRLKQIFQENELTIN